jgi:putative ribosome biogenesis GTPase RsgA
VIAGNLPLKKTSSSTAAIQKVQALSQYTSVPDQKSTIFYQFVATDRTNQLCFLLEGAALAKTDFALVGEAGAGKTSLMNKLISAQMGRFSSTHAVSHSALCSYTGVDDV